MSEQTSRKPAPKLELSKKKDYDVIVVGSGAAGGMAAFTLATKGAKVLLLEAGRDVDLYKESKTMEWPYKAPYRAQLPPAEHALNVAEYNMLDRPYGKAPELAEYKKVYSYAANRYSKPWIVDERELPFTGTPYAWVRARILGGKTLIWGRGALRLGPQDFKAKTHDGFGEDWPVSYEDMAPWYDRVDRLLGISGTVENLPWIPDGIFQRPTKLTCGEQIFKKSIAKMGRHLIPGRAGVTTEGLLHNRYRSRCMGRGRCGRGCDISANFHSPTALIYPAKDTGNCDVRTDSIVSEVQIDEATNRVKGVRVVDRKTKQSMEFQAKVVVLAASTLESTRLLLASKSKLYPNGLANSSGVVGHYFCEHIMGPRGSGYLTQLKGREATLDDGRPVPPYIPRFRNLTDKHPDFIRGYHFQGGGGCAEYPSHAHNVPGFGASFKQTVRELYPTPIAFGGFGEVLARYENQVDLDPTVTDAWGVPVLRFNYTFGDNEMKMLKDMGDSIEEMLHAAGAEEIKVSRDPLTPGWSIHELGTARMGDDSKTSVTNSYGQTHDVKNLFIADGSIFVSAGNQNPTWTILALAMRGTEYLAEELKKGNV
jgi:choline dehydrogenase-like flavoprotein